MVHGIDLLTAEDYIRIPLQNSKKIKFKSNSFKNISSRWNKFRLERIKRKLMAKKEDLVGTVFSKEHFIPGKNGTPAENKILRKTQAIAKLESQINFLENGEYHSEEFVNSRAIKLKSTMMENLVYNAESLLYCVTDQAAEEIMNGQNYSAPDDEEREKIGARVREILAEKAAHEPNADDAVQEETGSESSAQEEYTPEETIHYEQQPSFPVEETPGTEVSGDEIAEAIDNEMNRIDVSGNESSMAKVNRFVNEDGTYRLKGEDIDAELRFTNFDRSQLPVTNDNQTIEPSNELEISPFKTTAESREDIVVGEPRKALTAIVEPEMPSFPTIVPPTIRGPIEESSRTMPIVTPIRAQNGDTNLSTLMAEVSSLIADKETMAAALVEAQAASSEVEEEYHERCEELSRYADGLKAACKDLSESIAVISDATANRKAQIDAIVELMASSGTSATKEISGRVK